MPKEDNDASAVVLESMRKDGIEVSGSRSTIEKGCDEKLSSSRH